MTKTSTKGFTVAQQGISHLNPVLIPNGDEYIIFTSSSTNHMFVARFSEDVLGELPISRKKFGEGFKMGLDEDYCPNGIRLKDKQSKKSVIYSFGRVKYPYLLSFTLSTHETVNLNEGDEQLRINDSNGISNAAKTCVFGDGKFILVTSEENELLIYDVYRNKFVKRVQNLSTCLRQEDKKNMDSRLYRYLDECFDSQFLCKIKEEALNYQFLMINHIFMTLVDIKTDKGMSTFDIRTRYIRNNMLGLDDNIKVVDFACCYVEEYGILFISGGRSSKSNIGKDFVLLYDIETDLCQMSKIALPCTLAHHGMIYLPKTRCIHVVGGASYKYNEERELNDDIFYISIDAFKKDIDLLKNHPKSKKSKPKLNNKFSNEIPKN